MKYLFLLILVSSFFTCKKKTIKISEISVIKNGQYLRFGASIYSADNQLFDMQGTESSRHWNLIFKNFSLQLKKTYLLQTSFPNLINPSIHCHEFGADGDVLVATWGIVRDSQPNNYIDVLYYDEASKMLEGRFACTLFKVFPDSSTWATDSIIFEEGYFKVYMN